MTSITPEFLDQATFGGALLVAIISVIWRSFIHSDELTLGRFMTDLFNGAAIVPLLALLLGLFYPEVWVAASQSNRVLVSLACLIALFFVVRSIFTSNSNRL